MIWWLFFDNFEITQTTSSTSSPANISYNVRPTFGICIFTGMQTLKKNLTVQTMGNFSENMKMCSIRNTMSIFL